MIKMRTKQKANQEQSKVNGTTDQFEPAQPGTIDNEMLEATKRLADLEKDLWCVILKNPSKVRFPVMKIQRLLENDQKYSASKELSKLLSRACKPNLSRRPKSKYWELMDGLIDELLKIDIDREIVAIAKDEAIRRGSRRKANSEVLSDHAKSINQASHYVEAAKNDFIEANQALVITISERFSHGRMPFPDCVQEGNLGLMKAVNRFDYRLGYKFSTYAGWWIRAAIGRALESKECMVRVPGSAIRSQLQLKKAFQKLSQKNGRTPTDDEIAKETNMGRLKLSRARRHFVSGVYSLDENIPGSKNTRYIDMLPDSKQEDPLEKMQRGVLFEEIGVLMGLLTPLEQSIIKQRFGLDDEEGATLREIGEQYDLSRERVRQIQNKALEKLREGIAPYAA